ncbi:type III PLP-dependent enzyme [Nocardiopsis rhodophaea]|uniref:Type III PLP-dependent enzyme n=1 Tax=Nocardiopsis rhodophaea TaxID=280238 RepID=A0ABN2TLY1_9ACTN
MIELPKRVREHALGITPERLPACVYDLPRLDEEIRRLRERLPSAIEAHLSLHDPPPGMASALAPHVAGFEVSSSAALRGLRRELPRAPAALRGPGKGPDDIAQVLTSEGTTIHVDSTGELRLVAHRAEQAQRTADVLLRVDPPTEDGEPDPASSGVGAGMDLAALVECAEILRADVRVRLRGFSADMLPGLGATALADRVRQLIRCLRPWGEMFGIRAPRYAIGGGALGQPSTGEPAFDWQEYGALLAEALVPGETLQVTPVSHPGAWCGWYLTLVLDVKRNHGHAYAVVAGGARAAEAAVGEDGRAALGVIPLDDSWDRPWTRPELVDEPVTITFQRSGMEQVLVRDVHIDRLRTGDVLAFPYLGTVTADSPPAAPQVHCLTL